MCLDPPHLMNLNLKGVSEKVLQDLFVQIPVECTIYFFVVISNINVGILPLQTQ